MLSFKSLSSRSERRMWKGLPGLPRCKFISSLIARSILENCRLSRASSILEAHEALELTAADYESEVVSFKEATTVDMKRSHSYSMGSLLNLKAPYIIADGLDGLGRAASQWMVRHQARYLVLMYRSGPRTAKAIQLVSQLKNQAVHVEVPLFDLSHQVCMRDVIASCSRRLPPIAGCIQATMVLKVSPTQSGEG